MPSMPRILLALLLALPLPLVARPKAQPLTAAQLQAQVKKLTQERDELQDRLAATASFQQDLAAAQKTRDLAKAEAEKLRRDMDQMKADLAENQSGTESILKDMRKIKADLETCRNENASSKKDLDAANAKLSGPVGEGALVCLTQDVTAARILNLNRVVPKRKKVDRGVVVVNVLVSEKGEVLATRLLQGLPGEGENVQKANEACVEAAKRLVFDPARAADGKTPVKVWQGVGFYLE